MALPTHAPRCEIVTPDRSLVNETVDEVEIPGAEGYFGVLPGHTPLLAVAAGRRAVVPARGRRSTTWRSRSASPKCSRTASRSWRRSPSAPRRSTWRAPRRRRSAPRSGSPRPAPTDVERRGCAPRPSAPSGRIEARLPWTWTSERARVALLKGRSSALAGRELRATTSRLVNCFPTSPTRRSKRASIRGATW